MKAGRGPLISIFVSLAIACFRPLDELPVGKLNVGYISHIVVKFFHTRGIIQSEQCED